MEQLLLIDDYLNNNFYKLLSYVSEVNSSIQRVFNKKFANQKNGNTPHGKPLINRDGSHNARGGRDHSSAIADRDGSGQNCDDTTSNAKPR